MSRGSRGNVLSQGPILIGSCQVAHRCEQLPNELAMQMLLVGRAPADVVIGASIAAEVATIVALTQATATANRTVQTVEMHLVAEAGNGIGPHSVMMPVASVETAIALEVGLVALASGSSSLIHHRDPQARGRRLLCRD